MKKSIVLCADDYGQAPAISQGIIDLIQSGRLSATSCMVNASFWPEHSQWLVPHQAQVDIGLHFNLTEGKAVSKAYIATYGESLFSLSSLMRRACLHQLDGTAIEAECHAQIDQFEQAMGRLPNFIDGHQHVHQFPVIRTALLKVYEQRLRGQNAYIRLVNEKIKITGVIQDFKKIIIHALGTKALKQLLDTHKIPYNQTFAGIYSFSQAGHYQQLFPRFLAEIDDGGLIMCHPGLASSADAKDSIAQARYEEYQYFASNQFLADCEQEKVVIRRFY